MPRPMVVTSIRLPLDICTWLSLTAASRGETQSVIIRRALERERDREAESPDSP